MHSWGNGPRGICSGLLVNNDGAKVRVHLWSTFLWRCELRVTIIRLPQDLTHICYV